MVEQERRNGENELEMEGHWGKKGTTGQRWRWEMAPRWKIQRLFTRFGSIAVSRHWENEKAKPGTAGQQVCCWACRCVLLSVSWRLTDHKPSSFWETLKGNKEGPATEPSTATVGELVLKGKQCSVLDAVKCLMRENVAPIQSASN